MNPRRAQGLHALRGAKTTSRSASENVDQQADLGHLAEVAQDGGEAHLREQRRPDLRVALHLGRHALVRQSVARG